jgi:hypothetical protein
VVIAAANATCAADAADAAARFSHVPAAALADSALAAAIATATVAT